MIKEYYAVLTLHASPLLLGGVLLQSGPYTNTNGSHRGGDYDPDNCPRWRPGRYAFNANCNQEANLTFMSPWNHRSSF